MTTLTLPWPPSTNHYWRNVGGRVLISAAGRAYRQEIARIAAAGRTRGLVQRIPLVDRLSVTIVASPPDRRRRDLDNLLKSLLDALSHASVWLDDSQVDDLRVIRAAPAKPGRVEITISPLAARVAA
jgi:crossover junction endodeoxyribonuclease RusA